MSHNPQWKTWEGINTASWKEKSEREPSQIHPRQNGKVDQKQQ